MLKLKWIGLLLFLPIVFLGCNRGGDGTAVPSDKTEGNNIVVKLNLDSLPGSINFNRAATPDGAIEFKWGVTFDTNGDGVINQGDAILQILHSKVPGSMQKTGSIDDLEAALWVYTSDTETKKMVGIKKQISGNTIILTADKSSYSGLEKIDDSTSVYFETCLLDENTNTNICDFYPNDRSYSSIPADKQFTDARADVTSPAIDMINMEVASSVNEQITDSV